ncbi:NAD-binding protein [Bacillus sp. 1P10SD]|uniref:NAD-binding protein n=1 Tax=Bacillus sp. 1P10SD TaxID=3132265 RepID=UPI0039A647D7
MKRLEKMKKIHGILAIIITALLVWKMRQNGMYVVILIALMWATMGLYWVKFLHAYLLRSISLLLAIVSGVYGYYFETYHGYSHSFLNAIYSTIHLFFLNVDNVFNKAADPYASLPLSIEVARWSAAFYTISTISKFVLSYFGQSVRGIWLRFKGGHIIIAGFSEKAAILIENLRKEGYSVTVIEETIDNEQKNQLFDLGVSFYTGEMTEYSLYKKSGLSRAGYVILFHDDDSVNLDIYLAMRDYLEEDLLPEKCRCPLIGLFGGSKHKDPITILLHLNHAKSLQVYNGLVIDESEKYRSYSFSSYQLIAEKMLKERPLYEGIEEQLRDPAGDPLHLLLIGFGKVNQQIAYQALNVSHFLNRKRVRLTILDRNIEKVKKQWGHLAKFADQVADIDYRKVDLTVHNIKEELGEINGRVTHVFLALRDDYLDMIEGLELVETCPDIPVYIKMKDDRKVSMWLHKDQSEFKQIQRFSYFREVLNSEFVLNVNLKKLAKQAHENYQRRREELNLPTSKAWDMLDAFKQESTRYQMLHNDTKLMLLGLTKVPLNDPEYSQQVLSAEQFAEYIIPYIEPLAYVEHERWNAFHLLRGWKAAGEINAPREELDRLKLHQYLVPWNELTNEIKQYDRDSIIYLNEYYRAQNYGLVKI